MEAGIGTGEVMLGLIILMVLLTFYKRNHRDYED